MGNKVTKESVVVFLKKLVRHPLFYVTLGLFVIDIVSKWILVNVNPNGTVWLIPNFLGVKLVFNTGAIFGLGDGQIWARILFIVIRLILAILIPIVYFLKGQGIKTRYKVCLAMIYAGCIGNLVDSTFYWPNITGFSGVVDWIQFSFFSPTFNLADSYITIAVFLLIIFIIIDEIIEVREKNRKGAYTLTPEEYEKKLAEENKKKNGFSDKK